MKNGNKSLDDLKEEIKLHLKDYMELHGVEFHDETSYKCPLHNDTTASGHIQYVEGGIPLWKCFGECDTGGDIFTMAHHLEDMPLSGFEFVNTTIRNLCLQLGLEFDEKEILSERDVIGKRISELAKAIVDHATINSVAVVSNIMRAKPHYKEEYAKRIARKYNLFALDVSELLSIAKKARISSDIVKASRFGLNKTSKPVFSIENIIFPMYNKSGSPIHFSARRLDDDGSKYIFTPDSPIGMKREMFYLEERVGEYLQKNKTDRNIYVVEGHFDAIALQEIGIENVMASCSKTITLHHIEKLSKMRPRSVTFCFDSDEAGKRGLESIVKRITDTPVDFSVNVKSLPDEIGDPDDFVNKFDKTSLDFYSIEEVDIVKWFIRETLKDKQYEELRSNILSMCKLVGSFTNSPYVQKEYAGTIYEYSTDSLITVNDVVDEIKYNSSRLHEDGHKNADEIWNSLLVDTPKTPEAMIDILSKAKTRIMEVATVKKPVDIGKDQAQRAREIMKSIQSAKFINLGYKILNDVVELDTTPWLWFVPGRSQMGKSTFMRNLAISIWKANQNATATNAKAIIRYYTVDDNTMVTTADFVSMYTGVRRKLVRRAAEGMSLNDRHSVDLAWNRWIKEVLSDGSFAVLGHEDGVSLIGLREEIIRTVKTFSGEEVKIFIFYDNLMNMPDITKAVEKRTQTEEIANELHYLADEYKVNIISSLELVKAIGPGNRPRLSDIKETGTLEYRAGIISMCHQDLHADKDNTPMFWTESDGTIKKPIFELDVAKNKTNGTTQRIFYKLHSETGIIQECSRDEQTFYSEQMRFRKARKETNGKLDEQFQTIPEGMY